jgi:hypothetical protein
MIRYLLTAEDAEGAETKQIDFLCALRVLCGEIILLRK